VAVAVVERDTDRAAAGAGGFLPLTSFMLQCARHPMRAVVEQTVDFFLHLNTVRPSFEQRGHQRGSESRQLESQSQQKQSRFS
jgi:hypothetical protein